MMKLTRTIGLALCLLLELPATAGAQTTIAQDLVSERSHYGPLMSRAEIGTMLNAVVWKHRGEGYGLLRKDGGNNCPTPAGAKVSCDWIVNRTTRRGGDVLGSATNDDNSPAPATPSFNQGETFADLALFVEPVEPAGAGAGDNNPPPPPPPPPPATGTAANTELQQQQLVALLQIVTLQQQQLQALAEQNAALVRGLADLKASIAGGIKIRF